MKFAFRRSKISRRNCSILNSAGMSIVLLSACDIWRRCISTGFTLKKTRATYRLSARRNTAWAIRLWSRFGCGTPRQPNLVGSHAGRDRGCQRDSIDLCFAERSRSDQRFSTDQHRKPYEQKIPLLGYNDKTEITFQLQKDVDSIVIALKHPNLEVEDNRSVYLQKESAEDVVNVSLLRFSQEGDLSSSVTYDLTPD